MSDTPRKNRDTLWYFAQGADVRGPVEYGFLQHLMAIGLLLPNHMVRREGEETWIIANDVPGLFCNPDGSRPLSKAKLQRRKRRMYPAFEGDPRAPWTIPTDPEGGVPAGDDDDEEDLDDVEEAPAPVQDPTQLTKKGKSCSSIGCSTVFVLLVLAGAIISWIEDYRTAGRFKLSPAAAAVETRQLENEPLGYWRMPLDLEDIYLYNYVLYVWPEIGGFVPARVKLLEWHGDEARWIDVEIAAVNLTRMSNHHVQFHNIDEERKKRGEATGEDYAHSYFQISARPLKGTHHTNIGIWVYHKTTEEGIHYATAKELLWLQGKKDFEYGPDQRVFATWVPEK